MIAVRHGQPVVKGGSKTSGNVPGNDRIVERIVVSKRSDVEIRRNDENDEGNDENQTPGESFEVPPARNGGFDSGTQLVQVSGGHSSRPADDLPSLCRPRRSCLRASW